jgi:hypothetical protein
VVSKAFLMSENTVVVYIVEIKGHVVRQPHTLQCRAVMCKETKVACVKQASFFSVRLNYVYSG